jgi:hypothetical protein
MPESDIAGEDTVGIQAKKVSMTGEEDITIKTKKNGIISFRNNPDCRKKTSSRPWVQPKPTGFRFPLSYIKHSREPLLLPCKPL